MAARQRNYEFLPDDIARHKCLDCGVNVIEIGDYCLLNDRIWEGELGLGWTDDLCIACIETRLGRRLRLNGDFCSFPSVEGFPPSEMLMDRLEFSAEMREKAQEEAQEKARKRVTKRAAPARRP